MYKKILFPADDSVHSANALKYAADLAVKYGAEVVVMHTYYIPETFNSKAGSHSVYLDKIEKDLAANGENIINRVRMELENKNIRVKTFLLKSPVGPAIVSKAETEGVDIIIMGTRGIGNATSLLISSASNYTIHHSKCPVLLIH